MKDLIHCKHVQRAEQSTTQGTNDILQSLDTALEMAHGVGDNCRHAGEVLMILTYRSRQMCESSRTFPAFPEIISSPFVQARNQILMLNSASHSFKGPMPF